jgi:hypothetical protein
MYLNMTTTLLGSGIASFTRSWVTIMNLMGEPFLKFYFWPGRT